MERSSSAQANFEWGARTYVMGILNVTPDSFSGDGLDGQPGVAVDRAIQMVADGADVIDVGGMSTRPGHQDVAVEVETSRVMAVLPELVGRLRVPISIDSFRHQVVSTALAAGARVINDVWGLKREPRLAQLAAQSGALLVLMHNQEGTEYGDLMPDVIDSLRASVRMAEAAGVARARLVVDPGIGFGKTPEQNLEVIRRLDELRVLELPILLGTSRKSTIGRVLGTDANDRLEGSAATVALGIAGGADMVRVHDVKQMARVARMSDAVLNPRTRMPVG